jgi:hypothetical protein
MFALDKAIFIVSECVAISLADLNGSAIPLNEIQIATNVHQVSYSFIWIVLVVFYTPLPANSC